MVEKENKFGGRFIPEMLFISGELPSKHVQI